MLGVVLLTDGRQNAPGDPSPLVDRLAARGIPIYPSIALDRLSGEGFNWPVSEIAHQLTLERSLSTTGGEGFILWSIGPLLHNTKGIDNVIAAAK